MKTYTSEDISAVIISFDGENIKNVIDAVFPQVEHVIIVDNGSKGEFLKVIHNYDKKKSFTIIYNNENKGQAVALNQGWIKAKELGYKLVLTMDQDSLLARDCVKYLIEGINEGFDSVGPNYSIKEISGMYKCVRFLITSGNLLTVSALEQVGGFDDNLFIDSVDFDISLRLRMAGYSLAIVNKAKMEHYIGDRNIDDKGKEIFEHSIIRHYYIARNHYYILNKYFLFDPIFCVKKHVFYIKSLLEVKRESESKRKYEARIHGKKDARKLIKISRRNNEENP